MGVRQKHTVLGENAPYPFTLPLLQKNPTRCIKSGAGIPGKTKTLNLKQCHAKIFYVVFVVKL